MFDSIAAPSTGGGAQDEQLKHLFRHHQEETRQQISHLERAFESFGWDVDETANLAFKAFDKQAKAESR